MREYSSPPQGQPARTMGIEAAPPRRIRPGDHVLIYDALVAQRIWVVVDEILICGERTKIRSGNMNFFFDESLVVAHQKGEEM